jgi:Flp pilus assembly protein CpaB
MDLQRLAAAWHALSRGTARHRRLVAAALTGVAVLAALHVLRPAPGATVRVWVAARSVAGGRPLVAADVMTEPLPAAAVPAGVLSPPASVVGRLLAAPMSRGEPITTVRLLSPSLLAAAGLPGDVAVPVRTTDGPATLALVHAGDRVDVIATGDGETGTASSQTTVVHDVRVLATPTREDTDDSGETAGLLIVAATTTQAASLADVAGTARLSVAVQSGP